MAEITNDQLEEIKASERQKGKFDALKEHEAGNTEAQEFLLVLLRDLARGDSAVLPAFLCTEESTDFFKAKKVLYHQMRGALQS